MEQAPILHVPPPTVRTWPTADLKAHPLYLHIAGQPSPLRISELRRAGAALFNEPLKVTVAGVILDGHARWLVARETSRSQLLCEEYRFDSHEEEVSFLIATHLNTGFQLEPFCRVLLALELEPSLRQRARERQKTGARGPLPSELTKAESLDVREEVARLAGVCTGNVTKVKQILEHTGPEVQLALRRGQISINRAHQWRTLSKTQQKASLNDYLSGKETRALLREVIRRHKRELSAARQKQAPTIDDVFDLLQAQKDVHIDTLQRGGRKVYVISHPLTDRDRAPGPRQEEAKC